MHTILKTFPYSADGITVKTLAAGTEAEIRPDLVKGLVDAGYIGPMDEKAPELPPPPAFDPATADEDALRAFLETNGQKPHHKTGDAKLREMAAEILAKG